MLTIKLSIIFLGMSIASGAFAQTEEVLHASPNLVVEGIPDIPQSIVRESKKYNESRAAVLNDWNPVKREMLVRTRFGNSYQIHLVKQPGGARKQLTFFNETVSSASYEPVHGNFFLFLKDEGGNEFSQIYRYDLRDGNISQLTNGSRSQNTDLNWNHQGTRIAYGSTGRNGTDRDIYIMDPLHPEGKKLLLQVSGGGWYVADWSHDDKRLLLTEEISANESHLWILDIDSGKKNAVTPAGKKSELYESSFFSRDGRGIYFTTDRGSEFMRLAYLDLASGKYSFLTQGINWDVKSASPSRDGKKIAFKVNEAGISKLYVFSTDTHTYRQLPNLPVSVISGLSWRPNSHELAFNLNTAEGLDVYSFDLDNNRLSRWTESELGGMVAERLSRPQLVKWKSFDKLEISGFYYPADKKFKGKRPLIIDIHGGPESQSLPGFLGNKNYFLNELGVSIILPNARGSEGYGKTFLTLDNEKTGKSRSLILERYWTGSPPSQILTLIES